jgi:hypothetical protein
VQQYPKESMGSSRVIRGVDAILKEGDWMVDLNGHRPQVHDDPETGEDGRVLAIEVRHRLRT